MGKTRKSAKYRKNHFAFESTRVKVSTNILEKHLNAGRPIFLYFLPFFFFYQFVTEKEGKTCLNVKKEDFNQRTAYEAPIHSLKYTVDSVVPVRMLHTEF